MLLIGHYDSPFVRRIAVTLRTYGMAYDHEAWSTFGDADKIARYNPLRRVPTLVLDDGTVLVDSSCILAALDAQVGPDAAVSPELASRG
jgi:glutathione S-transferase